MIAPAISAPAQGAVPDRGAALAPDPAPDAAADAGLTTAPAGFFLNDADRSAPARRIAELGQMISAYSQITDRLRQSHERLERTVVALRDELSEKNRLLERKNRLAALGEMAAGMAHEIRNPLGGIQLYASLLGRDVVNMPPSLELVRKISSGVKRLESLVSSVLQFTREIRAQCVDADVAMVIDQALELASPHLESRGVKVIVDGPRPLVARIDPHLMCQALLNLFLNAADAMERGGILHIAHAPAEGAVATPAAAEVAAAPGAPDLEFDPAPAVNTSGRARQRGSVARQFSMSVVDSGPGIDPDALDRIFNPFFTTKDSGTGLGLAIVHRIIDAHDGTIAASNAPGGGARFEIRV